MLLLPSAELRSRVRSFLPDSACRHAARTVSSGPRGPVWRAVSEDSGGLRALFHRTRRKRAPPFIATASARSLRKPAGVRWWPRAIARTMRANVSKSARFVESKGHGSKNGITRSSSASRSRTTRTSARSRLLFGCAAPRPRSCLLRRRILLCSRPVFPADCPHPSRCHYRERLAGRHDE